MSTSLLYSDEPYFFLPNRVVGLIDPNPAAERPGRPGQEQGHEEQSDGPVTWGVGLERAERAGERRYHGSGSFTGSRE
jgi:hypothetical protein